MNNLIMHLDIKIAFVFDSPIFGFNFLERLGDNCVTDFL